MKRFCLLSPLLVGFLLLVTADAMPVLRSLVPIEIHVQLKSGDLIFRQGTDAVSAAVLAGKAKSIYSHVGMIMVKDGVPWVIHSVPAETESEAGGVKLEPLDLFARSDRAIHVAIMRPRRMQADTGARAVSNALKLIGRPFDAAFNLQDDSEIYCTELVARAYFPLNINLYQKLQAVQLPFISGYFLLPQDIFEQSQLTKVLVL